MARSIQERLRKLQALLRERGKQLSPEIGPLADALWNEKDETVSHDDCIKALPSYVLDEVEGKPVASLYPTIKHHLDRCDSCSVQYVALLELELADDKDELPNPISKPTFDLSFLRSPRPAEQPLARRSEEWWEILKVDLRKRFLMRDVRLARAVARRGEEEVARGETSDGILRWRIVQDVDQNLVVHLASHKLELEGARLELSAGEWGAQATLTRVAPDQVGTDAVLPREARPGDQGQEPFPLGIDILDRE